MDERACEPSTPLRTATQRTHTAGASSRSLFEVRVSPEAAIVNLVSRGGRAHRIPVATRSVYDVAAVTGRAVVRTPLLVATTRTRRTAGSGGTVTGASAENGLASSPRSARTRKT